MVYIKNKQMIKLILNRNIKKAKNIITIIKWVMTI